MIRTLFVFIVANLPEGQVTSLAVEGMRMMPDRTYLHESVRGPADYAMMVFFGIITTPPKSSHQ